MVEFDKDYEIFSMTDAELYECLDLNDHLTTDQLAPLCSEILRRILYLRDGKFVLNGQDDD